jgi:hypothetical protein
MSAPPQAIAPNPHTNLLNVYIQIAKKMKFQPKKKSSCALLPPVKEMDRGQEGPVKPAAAHGRLTDYAIPA